MSISAISPIEQDPLERVKDVASPYLNARVHINNSWRRKRPWAPHRPNKPDAKRRPTDTKRRTGEEKHSTQT